MSLSGRGVRSRVKLLFQRFLVLPGLVAAAWVALALLLVAIDRREGDLGVGFVGSAGAAREVLSTIAGSLITVAGLTFSIMIVTLQLVSQQFTPRALRGFLGDRLNQVVAGTFVGLFLYCLVVLTRVQGTELDTERFVPSLAIAGAVVGAVGALALLLVFIDHMAHAIQVSTIAASVTKASLGTVRRRFPATIGEPRRGEDPDALVARWHTEARARDVHVDRPGFLRAVTPDRRAVPPGTRVELLATPGAFVTPADVCARVWVGDAGADADAVAEDVTTWLVVGEERELGQDLGFGLRQLTDIAVRALSTGVNDPTTAITCVGYARAVLEALCADPDPLPVRTIGEDQLVVARPTTLVEHLESSLGEMHLQPELDPRVASALRDAATSVVEAARRSGRFEVEAPLERMLREPPRPA